MPRAVSCMLDGRKVSVEDALVLRAKVRAANGGAPAFRCSECGASLGGSRGNYET